MARYHFKKKEVEQQSKEQTQEPIIIETDLEKVTFSQFLKCLCNNDYGCLVVSGNPSPTEVYLSWIRVLSEYYVLIKSKEQERYIKLSGELESYLLKLTCVTTLIEALRLNYDENQAKLLKEWGFERLKLTPETLITDLKRAENELQNVRFKLKNAQIKREKDEKKRQIEGKVSLKEQYMKILYAIEERKRMEFDPETLTLYKFGVMYCTIMEQQDKINSQMEFDKNPNKK